MWDLTAAYVQPKYEIRLNVYNLTDKLYYFGGYQNNPNRVLPGAPRMYSMTVRYMLLTRGRFACVCPSIDSHPKGSQPDAPEIPDVLGAQQVTQFRARIEAAQWVDGNVTSGHQSAQAKYNEQLPEDSPEARELGERRARGARAQPAVLLRGAAEAGLSAAVQPLSRGA